MIEVKIDKYEVWCNNERELRGIAKEVFERNSYYFETENTAPVIVDAGAHVGLASLYFKKLYPESVVMAIEPNPENVELLRKNLEVNGVEKVFVLPVGLASEAGVREFFVDGSGEKWHSTGGFEEKAWNKTQESRRIEVPVKRLDELVDCPVDFLKMDIEGAELEVLESSVGVLRNVKQVVLEYHPIEVNKLEVIIGLLEEAGFGVRVYKEGRKIRRKHARGLVLVEGVRGEKVEKWGSQKQVR